MSSHARSTYSGGLPGQLVHDVLRTRGVASSVSSSVIFAYSRLFCLLANLCGFHTKRHHFDYWEAAR